MQGSCCIAVHKHHVEENSFGLKPNIGRCNVRYSERDLRITNFSTDSIYNFIYVPHLKGTL